MEVEEKVISRGLEEKFSQNKEALDVLIKTGKRKIVFATTFDDHLGSGHFITELRDLKYKQIKGDNLIGKILMEIREKEITEN